MNAVPPRSATYRAINTYELLQHILGYLDPHSLRMAALVEKHWHQIIHDSSVLEARLSSSDKSHIVRTVLIGMRGVGMKHLVHSFCYGPAEESEVLPDPTWEPGFRKTMMLDKEQWMIDGSADGYVGPGEASGWLGHALAHSETYILLYAASSRLSFDQITAWLAEINSPTEPLSQLVATQRASWRRLGHAEPDRCLPGAVVSTKNDLHPSLKAVDASEGAALARDLGCQFIETSAKTGDGVDNAFAEACRAYKKARLDFLGRRSKRVSLTKRQTSSMHETNERKDRWWGWYHQRPKRSRISSGARSG